MTNSPERWPNTRANGSAALRPDRSRRAFGAAAGLISAAVAVGVSQLAAGLIGPQGAPAPAVGGAVIDLAPPSMKNFAIATFGAADKTALIIGELILLAVFAAAIGVAALRRLWVGLGGLAVFAGIGLAAAVTRPGAGPADAIPTLAGAATAAFTLARLVAAAAGPPHAARKPARTGVPTPDRTAKDPRPAADRPAADRPAADPRPAGHPASEGPADPGGSWVPAPAAPVPSQPVPSQPVPSQPGVGDPPAPDRRRFLVTGAAALTAAGLSTVAGQALSGPSAQLTQARASLRLPRPASPAPPLPPGTDLRIPGLTPFVTSTGAFYRVDTALILPQVPPQAWRLRIHGMVEAEITLSYDDLLRLPLVENYTTLACVSNPVAGPYIGNAKWLGASLGSLLRAARVRAGADQLLCTSVDGFTSGTPAQAVLDDRDALLAVAMNGAPLPVAHGFPVRMVVPGLYGYVSATKWVTDIKVTTFAAEQAYWVRRGWSQQAPVKTESRIDVPSGAAAVRRGRTAVAGVAWAQHKGIDAVHVRVDGGPWQQARLAAAPGIDTWRQWVWEWDAAPGQHRIEARATDATGYTQTGVDAPQEPNGATGYPAVTVTVD